MRIALVVVSSMVLAYLLAAWILFVSPTSDAIRPVGAIVSLNGRDEQVRERYALSLVSRHLAPVLLFSVGRSGTACPALEDVTVVCFDAEPARTVGELAFVARYAQAHGINSLLVVAGHAQATRARLLTHRCFAGSASVIAAPIPLAHLPYEVLYETGAILKATVIDRGCR